MKIVFVVQSLRKGGAERVVSTLSKELEKMGHDVVIVLFRDIKEYDYGGRVVSLNSPPSSLKLVKLYRFAKRVESLKKIFDEEKPDKIYSFVESSNFVSILTGYDVVVSIRNNPLKKHASWQKELIKYLYKKPNVKKVVAVSKEIEDILKSRFNLKNTTYIHNPIVFDDNYKIKEDLSNYAPFILAVGRLHPQKNFYMLINAFLDSEASKKLKLLIVGEGKDRETLEHLIEERGAKDKVFLMGRRDNIKDFYAQAKMFVLSSRYEGFPNVLAEALSFSLPCIATDCPTGPKEIIKNEENALLIESENREKMREAIDRLCFDKELRNRLKENARKSVLHLDVKNIVRKWLELY
ncbi:MAG: glycosyltransferase family 4 protein [Epsilonproteobacteria bacterium]|nr:glycosyltransferase family 4 protein [Campylobacterota bacterium]